MPDHGPVRPGPGLGALREAGREENPRRRVDHHARHRTHLTGACQRTVHGVFADDPGCPGRQVDQHQAGSEDRHRDRRRAHRRAGPRRARARIHRRPSPRPSPGRGAAGRGATSLGATSLGATSRGATSRGAASRTRSADGRWAYLGRQARHGCAHSGITPVEQHQRMVPSEEQVGGRRAAETGPGRQVENAGDLPGLRVDDAQNTADDRDDAPPVGLDQVRFIDAGLRGGGAGIGAWGGLRACLARTRLAGASAARSGRCPSRRSSARYRADRTVRAGARYAAASVGDSRGTDRKSTGPDGIACCRMACCRPQAPQSVGTAGEAHEGHVGSPQHACVGHRRGPVGGAARKDQRTRRDHRANAEAERADRAARPEIAPRQVSSSVHSAWTGRSCPRFRTSPPFVDSPPPCVSRVPRAGFPKPRECAVARRDLRADRPAGTC